MAYQKVNIGDTGQQLVDKLDNNFKDVATDNNTDIPFALRPNDWIPGVEYEFADGSFGQRFVGTITAAVGVQVDTSLGLSNFYPISQGGWVYLTSRHPLLSVANGPTMSNFASLVGMTLLLRTIAAAARDSAPYDVWLRYTKT